MAWLRRISLTLTFLAAAGLSGTAHAEWIASWTAAPLRPIAESFGRSPPTPGFENRTLRQVVRISAGGKAVRLRLTNAYGESRLEIGAARIVLLDKDGAEVAGTSRALTFAGLGKASIAKGAPLLSDPVELAVPALSKLAIYLYLPGSTGPCTCHQTGLDHFDISPPGDFTAAPFKPESSLLIRAFIASVEVDAPEGSGTVAILADSISDGVGSTPYKDRRWPDVLAERLAARKGAVWGVANQGISGNRVLNDGMGDSALARLDRDVLAVPGVKAMILFLGVNDLGIGWGASNANMPDFFTRMGGQGVTAEDIIAGYRQIIERAHGRGIKVYGATIAPWKGASTWTERGEQERQKINASIRTGGAFDAVLDFDKAFADPKDPQKMADGLHMGDFLHGSDAGYRKVGESIDLGLFAD